MKEAREKNLVFIVGPTGSGKTDLAISLARHFGSPVVSADSRQIYRGMSIGTAQPSEEQLREVEHHFIATHDITENYTCGRYEAEALALLDTLFKTHDVVVAAGGSGLYIDALCHGMDSLPDADPRLRTELEQTLRTQGLDTLLAELKRLDPAYYQVVDRSNPQRVVRAVEVCIQTGMPYSAQRSGQRRERDFNIIKIGVSLPREELYRRIDRRVDMMIGAGLEKEARELYPHRELNSLRTVGYRELFDYFDGRTTRGEAIDLIKRNSRRYAKRQLTWFGRDPQIAWFPPGETGTIIAHITDRIK